MTITITSTSEVVTLSRDGTADERLGGEILCRVWEGKTESGIPVQCLLARIAAQGNDDQLAQFEDQLIEQAPPTSPERAFPLRMLI
jgi:hypothetical protein